MQKNSIKEDISVDRILWMFTFQTIKKKSSFFEQTVQCFLTYASTRSYVAQYGPNQTLKMFEFHIFLTTWDTNLKKIMAQFQQIISHLV